MHSWLLALLLGIPGSVPEISWVSNGGFESGTGGWTLTGDASADDADRAGGSRSLRIRAGCAVQDIRGLPGGWTCTVAASCRTSGVEAEPGALGYAYLAVYQVDEFGDLVGFRDFVQAAGDRPWGRASWTFRVEPEAAAISLRAGLHGARGTLWVDDWTLVEGGSASAFAPEREGGGSALRLSASRPDPIGAAAILDDRFPPLPAGTPEAGRAPAAERIERALLDAGLATVRADGMTLAAPGILDPARIDLLILPSGPRFPAAAAEPLRRFLKGRGKLIAFGGYAFDELLEMGPEGWKPYAPPAARGPGDVRWRCEIPAPDLRGRGPFTFSAWTQVSAVTGKMFAFLAVYQHAADGRLIAFRDICQLRGTRGWERQAWAFDIEPETARVDLYAGILEARGMAWFDDLVLTDAAGLIVAGDPTEDDLDPDLRTPGKWWRSDKQLLEIDGSVARSGKRSLRAKLRGAPASVRLNTRHGRPGDGLIVDEGQLGMFDPDCPIEGAVRIVPARGQSIFPPGFALAPVEGPLAGWSATGVTGSRAARWSPLLIAVDRYGRPRGAAGAMLRHYGGPWRGSSWAFFGLAGRDPFEGPGGAEALARLAGDLVRDLHLDTLKADPPCIRPGGSARIAAGVTDGGRRPARGRVEFEAWPLAAGSPGGAAVPVGPAAWSRTVEIDVPARGSAAASVEWRPEGLPGDFAFLRATLRIEGDPPGAPADSIEGGLVVWSDATVARGPRLTYEGNYLRIGGRPSVLFGTDDYGHVFSSDRETPLQWLRDTVLRRDAGIGIYENLQVGYLEGNAADGDSPRGRFFRQCDGIVQLSQACGQVYFPCLLCGYDVAVDDATLEAQAGFVREYAARYRDVPGLIYYLNGDLRCRIGPAVKPQWNAFLRERYGTTAALRDTWKDRAPRKELGEVPAADESDRGRAWDDVKAYDLNRFRALLIRRWTGRLIRAIREVDPVHPTTCEFYQLPHEGVDVPAGLGGLDLSNIGYFDRPADDVRRLPAVLALSDARARGKSLGPGEYGVKTHPAWGDGADHGYHIARTREEAVGLFLAAARYTLGLGGSRLHNWCWKDGAEWIFPWGIARALDGVEKDTLKVLRNGSLLFRHLAPVYRPARVWLLTPDSHRLGGAKWEVTEAALESIALLQSCHADLGILNEDDLVPERREDGRAMEIPPARAIFWPVPWCPPDAAYEAVLRWVQGGGILYISGDLSYDELRRRTRDRRLEELCGVRARAPVAGAEGRRFPPGWPGEPALEIEAAGAEAIARDPSGRPSVFRNRVGKGRVVFGVDPIELRPTPAERSRRLALYRDVLALAGAPGIPMDPDDPDVHLFDVPLRDGGRALVAFNRAAAPRRIAIGGPSSPVFIEIAPGRPGLVWTDGGGRIRAVEAVAAEAAGRRIVSDETGGIVLSLDGKDLGSTRALCLLPLEPGRVVVAAEGERSGIAGEVGEFRDGSWRAYEPAAPSLAGPVGRREVRIDVTGDQALSIILLSEPEALPAARRAIRRAFLEPWRME